MNVGPSAPFAPADAGARHLAITTLDRPLLVEAGAGTGKTTLLLDHVLHAIECGAARLPEVVAISFTEKAAGELRLRLRQEIERRLAGDRLGEVERGRLHQGRRELDRARISTIHSFAASILRERPVEARLDPQFRTLDELESAQLLRDFWNRWVDEQLESEAAAARLRAALLAGVRLEPDLFALARALYEQRDLAAPLPVAVPGAELEREMGELRRDIEACVRHAEAHCHDERDPGLVKLRLLGHHLEALADLEPSSWPAVFLQKMSFAVAAGRQQAWDAGAAAASKAEREVLRDRLKLLRQRLSASLLHDALGWLESFRSAYDGEKRHRGVLDFQDLLLLARDLLRDNLEVRRDIARGIRRLCVDEFQDTDPLQAEMVFFLAEEGSTARRWQDVRVGSKLFLVGDPKQSIYRFRRADLEVYERCADRVSASGGIRLDIAQNFRSRPAILQWVNGVFATLWAPGAAGEARGPRHVPLVPLPEDNWAAAAPPAVWVLRMTPPAAGVEPNADAWRRAEAAALADWLGRALAEGWPVRLRDGGTRPLGLGDVALLFGRTSGIEHYEDALRRAGLPFQQEGGKLFFQRQEVRDLLQALAAIDDPHDELSIVAALRSPLIGADDEQLWLHRARCGGFGYLPPPEGTPLAAPLALLAELHAARHELGVAGTLARLLDRTGARAVYALRPQGKQALANFDRLQRSARQFEAGRPAGLREFVRSLRFLDQETPRLAEWSAQEEAESRLRLLTVHMAKGLEFPCVVLANLSAEGSTHRPSVIVDRQEERVEARLSVPELEEQLATAGYQTAVAAEGRREEAEEHRLLYVAATRARDYLVVPCFGGHRDKGYLKALRQVPGALGDGPCGELPEPVRPGVARAPAGMPWCVVGAEDLTPVPAPPPKPVPLVDVEVLQRQRARWQEAHDDLLRRGGAAGGVLRPEAVARGAGAPAGRAAKAERLQDVVARVLERTPGGTAAKALRAQVREAAALHGVPEVVPEALTLVGKARAHALERRAGVARRVWRGLEVTAHVSPCLIEARLGLVFEEAEGLVVVEYSVEELQLEELQARAAEREDGLVLGALALEAGGLRVHEAGRLFLRLESYVVVGDLAAKVQARRESLAGRR